MSCALPSCAFDGPAGTAAIEVDSAGVAIVLNARPAEEWEPEAEPAVRVGRVDGGEAYLFHRVQFAGRLSDGRLAVADAGAHEIRWFDATGAHLRSFGRRGEGPGEFQAMSQVYLTAGDTVVVYDGRSRRVTWLTPAGELSRTRALPPSTSPELLGVTSGGTVVLGEGSSSIGYSRPYLYVREKLDIIALDETGPRTIAQLPGSESAWWVRFANGQPTATMQMGLPFGYATLGGIAGDHIVIGNTEKWQLEWYDTSGSLSRLARRTDVAPAPLAGEHRSRYVRHVAAAAEARGVDPAVATQDAQDRLALLSEERMLPSYDRMLTDLEGRIWTRAYVPVWAGDEPQLWTVYDRSGVVIADVRLPSRLRVMHIGAGQVTGVERDELDVEYVVSYNLP